MPTQPGNMTAQLGNMTAQLGGSVMPGCAVMTPG